MWRGLIRLSFKIVCSSSIFNFILTYFPLLCHTLRALHFALFGCGKKQGPLCLSLLVSGWICLSSRFFPIQQFPWLFVSFPTRLQIPWKHGFSRFKIHCYSWFLELSLVHSTSLEIIQKIQEPMMCCPMEGPMMIKVCSLLLKILQMRKTDV